MKFVKAVPSGRRPRPVACREALAVSVARRLSTRLLLSALALAAIVSLAVAPDRIAHAAPPPNPSDGQLNSAAAHKAAVAA